MYDFLGPKCLEIPKLYTTNMINNNNVIVLKGYKDSNVFIMHKKDFVNKSEEMIQDGVGKGVHETSTNTI